MIEDSLEQKAIELIEKLETFEPVATEAILKSISMGAMSTILTVTIFFVILGIGGAIVSLILALKINWKKDKVDKDFIVSVCIGSGIISAFMTGLYILIANPWQWQVMFNPELLLAKEFLTKVL